MSYYQFKASNQKNALRFLLASRAVNPQDRPQGQANIKNLFIILAVYQI